MIKFKGRSSIKQYLPKKPIKRGYKVWVLADKSDYAWKLDIYTGKKDNAVEKKLGERFVKHLTENIKVAFLETRKNKRLLQAAEEGALQEMQVLLAAGADAGAKDTVCISGLHRAARERPIEPVKCLVDARAVVDSRTNLQNTPLHLAAWKEQAAVVRLLAALSADPNARNQWGMTPLHRAALDGHVEATAALLAVGASPEARDDIGATPRHLARKENHQDIVELLT
ncbi:serine/threonine-protein phosphatase 6 regulatory ankyrin repeat subunit B-like [Schistocerca piceifrons]|uniref:serine/threonine-protein phosphatase 6 regulatory ankyrin repeat subunit B-like n=1 Tax=Schistocerca piceifrons TaxID=274613 RepID=UPI001F5EB13B|nr:serine/threonine-protein phosphatase 6 regulatory ankyrin repeat subunit B-like [Schistocerca piceifrons]